jgi:hypothetical protein
MASIGRGDLFRHGDDPSVYLTVDVQTGPVYNEREAKMTSIALAEEEEQRLARHRHR